MTNTYPVASPTGLDYERRQNQWLTARTWSVMSERSKIRANSGNVEVRRPSRSPVGAPRTGHFQKKWESAGKPGSVVGNHSSGMHVAVHLERPTRERARAARCGPGRAPACVFPYLALLRAGFAVPVLLPVPRCALTAPFHPCQQRADPLLRRFAFCCTFRGLAPPRRYLAPCPVEPGLSSRGHAASDCLADSRRHHRAPGPGPQASRAPSSAFCRARARS